MEVIDLLLIFFYCFGFFLKQRLHLFSIQLMGRLIIELNVGDLPCVFIDGIVHPLYVRLSSIESGLEVEYLPVFFTNWVLKLVLDLKVIILSCFRMLEFSLQLSNDSVLVKQRVLMGKFQWTYLLFKAVYHSGRFELLLLHWVDSWFVGRYFLFESLDFESVFLFLVFKTLYFVAKRHWPNCWLIGSSSQLLIVQSHTFQLSLQSADFIFA